MEILPDNNRIRKIEAIVKGGKVVNGDRITHFFAEGCAFFFSSDSCHLYPPLVTTPLSRVCIMPSFKAGEPPGDGFAGDSPSVFTDEGNEENE
jgi:hypothetical protein